MTYIAHRRESDHRQQSVFEHLTQTGDLAAQFAGKIGLPQSGLLLGLLHDFGKYSQAFQDYIRSAQGLIDPDDVNYVDAKSQKGKIDHATAGAQYLYQHLQVWGGQGQGERVGQILAICIASHHSGLIDTLAADWQKGNRFDTRMDKADKDTHFNECCRQADPELLRQVGHLITGDGKPPLVLLELEPVIRKMLGSREQAKNITASFALGMLTRFLFSCLIDADRLNSAEFSEPARLALRLSKPKQPDWPIAIDRLESKLARFPVQSPIDQIRRQIAEQCRIGAAQGQGIYSLTVPTGGGKTLASLRYALHHAATHQLDRVFYIIPFTSIIEQNAAVMREALERDGDDYSWVLEHHANLEPEQQTWQSKISTDNWDAPVVVTTMVQFLEALFAGGTGSVRRLHPLANSVIIFDEIQTLPVNCTHLFCNALDFLVRHAGSTALLCTATQPLLGQLENPHKGQLTLVGELIDDVSQLFTDLSRVRINNACKMPGWEQEEIVDLMLAEYQQLGSCLVIVNTKQWAQQLYQACADAVDEDALFHLSTNLCPAHRKALLARLRQRLEHGESVLCISTQLIEAGVDVDFAVVIRFLAGLDSIAQAAGRCNRHGYRDCGVVHVVNPREDNTRMLPDIEQGKAVAQRVMDEGFDDLLSPAAMARYFEYYFYQRAGEMDYACKDSRSNPTTLLKLLSNNWDHPNAQNDDLVNQGKRPRLEQSFMEAGRIFQAINAPTQAVIVIYRDALAPEGEESRAESVLNVLMSTDRQFDPATYFQALRQAQQYSVNVFPHTWQTLLEAEAIRETQPGSGIFYLNEQYYHPAFGLSTEPVVSAGFLSC